MCVCGQDLSSQGEHRQHIENMIAQSSGKEEKANYLAQVLHAANTLHRHKEGADWDNRCSEHESEIHDLDEEIRDLDTMKRDIDAKLKTIDDDEVEVTRGEVVMLEKQLETIDRNLGANQETLTPIP